MPYSVVVFDSDNSVDTAPTSWISIEDEVEKKGTCYWPLKNIRQKIKDQQIPDKRKWSLHDCRVISDVVYQDYKKARKASKRGEVTSNVESEDEASLPQDSLIVQAGSTRTTNIPARYRDHESSDTSEEENNEETCEENQQKTPKQKTPTYELPKSPTYELPKSPMYDLQQQSQRMQRDAQVRPEEGLPLLKRPGRKEQGETILSQVLDQMKTLESQVESMKLTLDKVAAVILKQDEEVGESLEEVLPEKICTVTMMQELETRLKEDGEFQKKLINILSKLRGGMDLASVVRDQMRSVFTNGLMSKYSLTGQKGKLCFMDTSSCKTILRSIRRATKDRFKIKDLEYEIAEVLRNAPNHPGGANYVKKNVAGKRKRGMVEEEKEN
ncbi:uncharacterized protein LOC143042895 isoform X4 [Mytilus galloprovincialis]|uniref:uncharacterized protein LOC143042895 isoform X4 n=1 Tax=Mytilus galloprovincialis TaxID=29158 RepID=UPI003F7C7F65